MLRTTFYFFSHSFLWVSVPSPLIQFRSIPCLQFLNKPVHIESSETFQILSVFGGFLSLFLLSAGLGFDTPCDPPVCVGIGLVLGGGGGISFALIPCCILIFILILLIYFFGFDFPRESLHKCRPYQRPPRKEGFPQLPPLLLQLQQPKYRCVNLINPSVTARVKISQNVDILAKVYLVHLKVKHCQTLRVVSTFTGQDESIVFGW